MKSHSALKVLKSGNSNFIQDLPNPNLQNFERRKAVLDAQNPYAVILTCSDSRVVPELIFNAGIGDLFVIRVAGNIANTSSIASIEYAVAHLDVKLIVVLAHQNCGAVSAALSGKNDSKNLKHLLAHIKPTVNPKKSADEIARVNADLVAKKLVEQSSIIAKAMESTEFKILPAYYNLDSGKVDFFE